MQKFKVKLQSPPQMTYIRLPLFQSRTKKSMRQKKLKRQQSIKFMYISKALPFYFLFLFLIPFSECGDGNWITFFPAERGKDSWHAKKETNKQHPLAYLHVVHQQKPIRKQHTVSNFRCSFLSNVFMSFSSGSLRLRVFLCKEVFFLGHLLD